MSRSSKLRDALRKGFVADEPVAIREISRPEAAQEHTSNYPDGVPPLSMYLDPDLEKGRKRIIIMFSEDMQQIEPTMALGGLTRGQQAVTLAQMAYINMQEIVEIALRNEELLQRAADELAQAKAEIAFLTSKFEAGEQPMKRGTDLPLTPRLMPDGNLA